MTSLYDQSTYRVASALDKLGISPGRFFESYSYYQNCVQHTRIDYDTARRLWMVALPRDPYSRCPEGILYCLCDFDFDLAEALDYMLYETEIKQ